MNIKFYTKILLLAIFMNGISLAQCPTSTTGDYGDCEMAMGWTWNGADCGFVSGCGLVTNWGDDYSEYIFTSYDECTSTCQVENYPGDVNFDGSLNVVDIVLIIGYIIGNNEFSEVQINIGDYSEDGFLNVVDIVSLVNIILNGLPQRDTWEIISEDILEPNCAAACHESGTFFAEQTDLILTADVAYEQLIDRIPRNESAWADGLVLLSSMGGQPGEIQSFLWEKINLPNRDHFYDDHPYYGEIMPLGGPFLSNGELAFIQEWIHAGAPETGAVADELHLLDESVWEAPPFEPLEIPENGVQFHLGPFEIWDGYEREVFSYQPIGNDDYVYINQYEILLSPGSHHMIFYTYPENVTVDNLPSECGLFVDQFPPPAYELRDLHDQNGVYNYQSLCYMGLQTFFAGTQWPYMNYHFPPGVALKVPPSFGVDINSHFLNYSGNAPSGEIYGNIYFVEPEEVQHVADIFMLNNTDINLPGNETTTITRNYMFPGQFNAGFLGNGSDGDIDEIYIFQLFSHAHERMDRFDVKLIGGPNDGQVIYTALDWEHPPILELNPPLVLEHGMGLKLEATYTNNTNNTISYGLLGANEMMILFGHYYTD